MDSKKLLLVLAALGMSPLIGCGVKGDPLPPERPPELGRGRPTYKRATEKIKVQKPDSLLEEEDSTSDEDGE